MYKAQNSGTEPLCIIIPVYNGAGVIGDTIDSIYNDGFGNVKTIAVCNGCSDGSERVLDRMFDGRSGAELYVFDKRIGRNKAINKGLSESPESCPVLILGQENTISGIASLYESLETHPLSIPTTRIVVKPQDDNLLRLYTEALKYIFDGSMGFWGVYALNHEGKGRLHGRIPENVTLDDLFVCRQFERDEIGFPDTQITQPVPPRPTVDEAIKKLAMDGYARAKETGSLGFYTPEVDAAFLGVRSEPIDDESKRLALASGLSRESIVVYGVFHNIAECVAAAFGEKMIADWHNHEKTNG